MVSINNPVQSTLIFISIFVLALVFFVKSKKDESENNFFPISLTNELKGFAILAVIFSHIGYFLVYQHDFLFPLTILAGVGVNIFLFLSGLGLTISALKKDLTILDFYKKRLLKLFVPLWIVLIIFFLADYLFLNINYSWQFVGKSFLGIFNSADIFKDVNSPLWYFTLILFYYLIFPFVFSKKRVWLSAGIIYLMSFFILYQNFDFMKNVLTLYKVHIMAFPLGMIFAWLFSGKNFIKIKDFFAKFNFTFYLRYFLIFILLFVFNYFIFHSGVGEKYYKEELISIITTLVVIFIFYLKQFEFKIFSWFGIYSYEIYLLHWPIMYRYDFLYKSLPGWLSTLLYLILFIALGFVLKKASELVLKK
jgi:peptidoglycan/LPS O-acetylase OafA/YrhL